MILVVIFLWLKGDAALFYPPTAGTVRPTISLGMRQKKNMICSSKIKRENHENQQEVAEKRKEIRRDSCEMNKERNADGEGCAEKKKEMQSGRVVQRKRKEIRRDSCANNKERNADGEGCSQNDNEQYHANEILWGCFMLPSFERWCFFFVKRSKI